MKILMAAGGTGGHLYPAVALVRNLKKKLPSCCILWIGGKRNFERSVVEKEKVSFYSIDLVPFPRNFSLQLPVFAFKMVRAFLFSVKILLVFKPDIVVGVGSFHSYPVVISAFLFGIPTLICEQNVYPSLTNKMLSVFACKIALSFPETANFLPKWCRKKSFVTGNPIREEIITTSRSQGIKRLGLAEDKFCILFLGGSQGASFLNKVAIDTLFLIQKEKWGEEIQYILLTGEKDYLWVLGKIKKLGLQGKVFSYLSEISFALAVADLVVSRSGATTVSEILARGIPCILIPYPFATSQHQLTNALYLKNRQAAEVIVQEKLTAQVLKERIKKIYFNKELRERMKKASNLLGKHDATAKVSKLILSLVK